MPRGAYGRADRRGAGGIRGRYFGKNVDQMKRSIDGLIKEALTVNQPGKLDQRMTIARKHLDSPTVLVKEAQELISGAPILQQRSSTLPCQLESFKQRPGLLAARS